MRSSSHWKFWIVLFPIIGTCALANFPGGMKGFFATWSGMSQSGTWRPSEITNAISWWAVSDADSISVVAGTNRVSEWRDKISTNHFTQTASGNRPSYIDDPVTAQKTIYVATGQELTLGRDIIGSNRTFMIVYRKLASNNSIILMEFNSQSQYPYLQYGNTFYVGNGTQTVGINTNGFEMRGAFTGTSGVSVVRYSNAVAQVATSFDSNVRFGRIGNAGFGASDINIRELVWLSGVLSTQDRQKLEGYLAHNNDIENKLPSDHPYRNSPP